jgi:hypothetical protein
MTAAKGMGDDPARRPAYVLNPRFKQDIAEGRQVSWLYIANVAVATAVLGVINGTHLANIGLARWLRTAPGDCRAK